MKIRTRFPAAFTLIELLVVIAIIAVLAALILPIANRSVEQGRSQKCAQYLRQFGTAVLHYASDHEMQLPVTSHQRRAGGKSWSLTLQPYASGTLIFRCPCDEDAVRPYSYVMNDFLTPNPAGAPTIDFSVLSRLENPRECMLFGEASKDYADVDHFHFSEFVGNEIPPEAMQGQVAVERHLGAANYLFADGHAETVPWESVRKLLSERGSRFLDPTATGITTP
jgi:prepilin-type N-terminal cleavage/methylation domain-containing protein/prepilin-type processing-associated H-X9-DG protein